MDEERTWRKELTWWLSAGLTLLAVLLPVAAGEAIYRALNEPGADVDRLNVALGWTILLPVQVVFAFWPFFISGALSARLLVPAFAGANPRAVTSLFCTAAVVLGVFLTTRDGLTTLAYGGAALVWALIMPLPLKDLLSYGPLVGGLILGMGLATLLNVTDGLLIAIAWCIWRLYRDHPTEVTVIATTVAMLPLLMILDDPRAAVSSASSLYNALEALLLLLLAIAGIVLGQFFRYEEGEAEGQ